jgi:CRISPR-associated protein Cmr6
MGKAMTKLPLPKGLADFFAGAAFGQGNRSLLHARGMDRYDQNWKLDATNKKEFLNRIRDFDGGKDDYPKFVERRNLALSTSAAPCGKASATSTSRLVCGLGLPHPIETSILLDRLTGAPYLPGSSVKGMLRSAAHLAASAEFPADCVSMRDAAFWKDNLDRVFGPPAAGEGSAAKGQMVFYDALPAAWPKLEVDVLTPHYGPYYMDGKVPGDWFSPVPVYFLAVSAGTKFFFWYRSLSKEDEMREADEAAIARLLPVALDWLGIGGKKSSGYGAFKAEEPTGARQDRPQVFDGVALSYSPGDGRVTARIEGRRASALLDRIQVPPDIRDSLKRRHNAQARVVCEPQGRDLRIVRIEAGQQG